MSTPSTTGACWNNSASSSEQILEPSTWCATWISAWFDAFEAVLAADTRRSGYSFGSTPSIADVYMIPQIESAGRFTVDLRVGT